MTPFFELHRQIDGLRDEIDAALGRVLDRGSFILGEELAGFEREFGEYLGVPYVIGVGSGTDAITLALRALGVGPRDEVVTAPNTCVPTAAAIINAGATPVLADVDPVTLTLSPAALESKLTPRTRAVVPVHLYGYPCDMPVLLELTRAHGLALVEDCAQAHGSRLDGKLCGTFGDAAAFSFYPTKNLGALGDGGAVATRDPEVAQRVRMLRNYGERERYRHAVEGVNSRMDEMQAAVLRVKLPHLERWNAARQERARLYDELLGGLPLLTPARAARAVSNYHLYAVRLQERDALQAYLRGKGISTLLHYPVAIHLQEAYRGLRWREGAFPVAEQACRETLSLPLYPELPIEAVHEVAGTVRSFFERA